MLFIRFINVSLVIFALFFLISTTNASVGGLGAKFRCAVKSLTSVEHHDPHYASRPFIDGGKTFYGGQINNYEGDVEIVTSPILDGETNARTEIGRIAQMKKEELQPVLDSAKLAWNRGQGIWPQMTVDERIESIERVVKALKKKREQIVNVLMWEICKSAEDAAAEFDRTMIFIESVIQAFRNLDKQEGSWKVINGILAKIRRTALGIILVLGPFNYPFNETYATLIPALLTGNIIIMKIPTTGGLAHMLTMEAYAENLPPGVMNFVSGSGRELLGPLMSTGEIDSLAFIGGSKAADAVIKSHPNPHRLKVFLQLEGKNLGIVMPDADLDVAVEQVTLGSTSYNGQRCTAIKLVFVHHSIANTFLQKFKTKVSQLTWGLPWVPNVSITPLPEYNKVQYLTGLVNDALSKGAEVINSDEGGCDIHGALFRPAIVYPVNSQMRLWHEEQFGPVIPVAVYNTTQEIYDYLYQSHYGQQAAIFTKTSYSAAPLVDMLSTVVGRININTQCSRSPDVIPFSGRRSSALGTMSVEEALKTFSIETVVAGKANSINEDIMKEFEDNTNFLKPLRGESEILVDGDPNDPDAPRRLGKVKGNRRRDL